MTVKEIIDKTNSIDAELYTHWRVGLDSSEGFGDRGIFDDELIWDWADRDSDIPFLLYALGSYTRNDKKAIERVLRWHISRHPELEGLVEAFLL